MTPIGLIPASVAGNASRSIADLAADGTLTAPLERSGVLKFVSTASRVSRKGAPALQEEETAQFSRRDEFVFVFALLTEDKRSGETRIGLKIHDAENKARVIVPAAKVKWPATRGIPARWSVGFSPASLAPGTYRVDVLIDQTEAGRTVILITP